jgi:ketosteroid isomerase-like protein
MMRTITLAMVGCLAFLTGCAPQSSQDFDPNDPEALAAIESIMTLAIEAAAAVDPVGVMEHMGGGDDFTLVTGDVILTGLQRVQDAFSDTYAGLEKQENTLFETRTRLVAPDVAVVSVVGEGTYTDLAGWTSEPVGLGITIIFVREDGQWKGRHVHQSIALQSIAR